MAIKKDAYRVKSLYITPFKQGSKTGIEVEWNLSSGKLRIGGWYDSIVAMESRTFTLAEFFKELGINEEDIKKAMATETENSLDDNIADHPCITEDGTDLRDFGDQ
ncbi:MAG: hypothetical protein WBK76_00370 [Candidatus Saccharimonadales bacterium]